MKKNLLALALISVFSIQLSVSSAQQVVDDSFNRLQVHYSVPTPDLQSVPLGITKYNLLDIPGYMQGGEIGAPSLPIRSDVIEVPFCDDIVVSVSNAVYDTLDFSSATNAFLPFQPSRSKSDTTPLSPVIDGERYQTSTLWGLPLAEVEYMGIARDRRLAQLRFSPVQVNPVTGQVVVCRSADITVTYVNADADHTLEYYRRYHTPVFSLGPTLNNLFAKAETDDNIPIRMYIVVRSSMHCRAIDRFADWKRSQGLMVDVLDKGTINSENLALDFQERYDTASAEYPAPTFILLVGDHAQLPAFNSRITTSGWNDVDNDHITDLYFVTWTAGDDLPDCYQGRFSATDTVTLEAIIDKTMLYEQYAFTDDSYLGRAALIAGEDNGYHTASGWTADYAWIYADPAMDYIAYNYVNADNGYNEVYYYKNDVSYAPDGVNITGYCSNSSAATELSNLYSSGLGWINYSAHGDWDRWHKPSFTVSNVNSMNNSGKPSFMIGNCCLSNKFDKPTCFGEALLRRGYNAGAVCYIGGTNSTYWTQDFYWAVGLRSSISHNMAPTYYSNRLGAYDRLFHTHDEDHSNTITTAGAIVYYGNYAVNSASTSSTSSNMKKYYWEIYELMGDPSLMPWLGRAADLTVTVNRTSDKLTVNSAPYAYVAIVDSATLKVFATTFASASGQAKFDIASSVDLSGKFLTITSQNYKPFRQDLRGVVVGINSSVFDELSIYPNPATDQVTIDGLPQNSTVELYDAQGRKVFSDQAVEHLTLNTKRYSSGLYLLRIQTPIDLTVRKLIIK